MSRSNILALLGILLLAALALVVDWPTQPVPLGSTGLYLPAGPGVRIHTLGIDFERLGPRLGLDLQGGTHLVLQADMSKVTGDQSAAIRGVAEVINRRVNGLGVSEPIIQVRGTDRVIVELPGVKDIEEAKRLIGKTAQLDFRELGPDGQWKVATAKGDDGQEKPLTGAYFSKAEVGFEPNTQVPIILFEFNAEGAKMFGEISTRLVGKQLGIFLDNQELTAPVVREPITGGRGQITGNFTLDEARTLVIQLNAGALPVPVSFEEERTVDATLGADSIHKSITAGAIALAVVALFMILYYRLPGVLATLALVIYTLVTLALFILIPVTLTLSGIFGLILSIGMAVDANILIFERTREELRAGKTVRAAVDAGFTRAWTSIRDSNVSTLITCGILYWFGSSFGASIIMGFALTLAIGVAVSMFSAITVTRTFLHLVQAFGFAQKPSFYGMHEGLAPATGATGPLVVGSFGGGSTRGARR